MDYTDFWHFHTLIFVLKFVCQAFSVTQGSLYWIIRLKKLVKIFVSYFDLKEYMHDMDKDKYVFLETA